jgi:hypothetical protein
MMPYCAWGGCQHVGENHIDINVPYQHPYLCDKHYKKLLKKLGIKLEDKK